MSEKTSDERLLKLLKISKELFSTRETALLHSRLTDAFLEEADAQRGALLLRDGESSNLNFECGRTRNGEDLSEDDFKISSIASRVLKENSPIFVTDTSSPSPKGAEEGALKIVSCVPLSVEDRALGVIYTEGYSVVEKAFQNNNQRFLEILSEHAAAACENARLFERATNDPLTGLPNNSYFMHELAKAMKDASGDAAAGILLLDMDSFKRVNTAAGAGAGDQALIDIANTLQDIARADGLVARYSSDKFAILLPPEQNVSIALRLRDVAERARAAVGTKVYHGIRLSASIGGVAFPDGAKESSQAEIESAPDMVAAADDLLAKARARGMGEVEIGEYTKPKDTKTPEKAE